MGEAIGIRLDDTTLKKIEELTKEEEIDRSTAIRKLVKIGYDRLMKQKAFDKYRKGKVSLSGAAKIAGITIWEMEQFMTGQGFVSQYSIEDLKNEIKGLDKP